MSSYPRGIQVPEKEIKTSIRAHTSDGQGWGGDLQEKELVFAVNLRKEVA